jgi:methylenetetrahydrofolate reductase (NADPH)
MFFDNDLFYSFLSKVREAGIYVPIIAGIMPVTNAAQIRRMMSLSSATLPTRFRRIVDRFGDSPEAMQQAGIAYATEQIIDLYANGVKAVHVYSMNKPDVASAIKANLSHII